MLKLAEGVLVAERFKLVRELGRGGMGSVWLAHHVGLDTRCAVKFIHPDVSEHAEVRDRFEREAKAAAQLRTSHVVQVLDYGTFEGTPYIAMEYLEGEDLAHRLDRDKRLGVREVVAIVAQLARALTKAHALGLVHRDLKPENVFLAVDDDREIVKVLDFGIAKGGHAIRNGSTHTGALLGTPGYMSPEQVQGSKALDYRSDLWSLGVLAFVCLVGRPPFEGQTFADLLLSIVVRPVPVPSEIAPDLPRGFDAWWARACARDATHRFQSANEMAGALAEALGVVPMGDRSAMVPRAGGPRVPPHPTVAFAAYSPPPITGAPVSRTFASTVAAPPPATLLVGAAGALVLGSVIGLFVLRGSAATSAPSPAASEQPPPTSAAASAAASVDAPVAEAPAASAEPATADSGQPPHPVKPSNATSAPARALPRNSPPPRTRTPARARGAYDPAI